MMADGADMERPGAESDLSEPRRRWWTFRNGLIAVVLLAAVLRLWSIDFGVPMVTHPDEVPIVFYASGMVEAGDLNPRWFRYPAFIIYMQAAVILVVDAVASIVELSDETIISAYYVGGRVLVAAFGIATVALVGLLGRRLVPRGGDLVGLAAAAMMAVSFLHIKDSHYLKPDVPIAFFAALTLWFTLDALNKGRLRYWCLAAASVGLAAACKYNGALVALVPAAALLAFAYPPRTWLSSGLKPVPGIAGLMTVVAVTSFLLVNPYVVITPDEFLSPTDGIVAEWDHYREGHEGAEGDDTWRWYFMELWRSGIGPTLMPLVMVGLVAGIFNARRGDSRLLLLLIFPIIYYAFISRYPVRFDRQLMPILPFLALLGAWWLPWLRSRIQSYGRTAPIVAGICALVLVLIPLVQAAQWNIELGRTDTRYPALDWVRENVEPDAVIAHEHYTPPLADAGFRAELIWSTYEQPADWFDEYSVEYLMISSYIYQRYLDEPGRYPSQAAFYDALLSRPTRAAFAPDGDHSGPEIYVFHIDDISGTIGVSR
jgi:4-amino-4-deoxy-L-arabinose transferase-like glycosyltransferase